jgi:MFS family permease
MRWSRSQGLLAGLASALIIGLIAGLNDTLAVALGLGLASGVYGGLVGGLTPGTLEASTRPNQGIHRSIRYALYAGLFGGLASALTVGLTGGGLYSGLRALLYLGLLFLLLLGPRLGGAAVIQHFVLRLLLARMHATPYPYVRFLEAAVDNLLLRRVGGGYRFPHRLLQERLASYPLAAPLAPDLCHIRQDSMPAGVQALGFNSTPDAEARDM